MYESLDLGEVGVTALAFSPDGAIVAVGLSDGSVKFYHLKTRQWGLQTGVLHDDCIQALALTPDGKLLVTCSAGDTDVVVTDARTGVILRRLPVGAWGGYLTISPDGKTLAAGTDNPHEPIDFGEEGWEERYRQKLRKPDPPASVFLWSIPGFQMRRRLMIPGCVYYLSFAETRKLLVVSHGEGAVYSLRSGKKIWSREGDYARTGSISPNGRFLAYDEELWDIVTNKKLEGDGIRQYNHSRFSQTGRFVLSGSRGDGTHVFDGRTGKKIAELQMFQDFAALSPDGSVLAGGYQDYEISLYSIHETSLRRISYAHEHPL